MSKLTLGLRDKNGEELFAGDKVQIVNGAKSGTVLYAITAAAKAYTISGEVRSKDGRKELVQITARKVMRLTQQ